MAIKIHGPPYSHGVQRSLLALEEKELDYDLLIIDIQKGEHKRESFLALNPFGQVPAFEDGDLKLFESRAINQYLASNYADQGTPLISSDPKKQAMIGVWLEVESQRYDGIAIKILSELLVKPVYLGQITDEVALVEYEAKLSAILDVYEARLSESKYLGGDSFSLADLHHIPSISSLLTTKAKAMFESRPHVSAWAKEILERPAWSKVLGHLKH